MFWAPTASQTSLINTTVSCMVTKPGLPLRDGEQAQQDPGRRAWEGFTGDWCRWSGLMCLFSCPCTPKLLPPSPPCGDWVYAQHIPHIGDINTEQHALASRLVYTAHMWRWLVMRAILCIASSLQEHLLTRWWEKKINLPVFIVQSNGKKVGI